MITKLEKSWVELVTDSRVARVTIVRTADAIVLTVGLHVGPNPIPKTECFRGELDEVFGRALEWMAKT